MSSPRSPRHLPRLRRSHAVVGLATAALVAAPAVALAAGAHSDHTQAARQAIQGGKARNVILLIGDGMGDSEITIARNYQVGAAGRLAMDTLPLTGAYTTYAVQKDDPTLPDYVTDSAASGTGWATGHKSYNGAISVLPDGKPVPTILELAKKAGYRTGDVTTAELQDATPAVLGSHVVSRDCKGPHVDDRLRRRTRPRTAAPGRSPSSWSRPRRTCCSAAASSTSTRPCRPAAYAGLTRPAAGAGRAATRSSRTPPGWPRAEPNAPILGTFAKNNMDLEWVGPTPTTTGTAPSTLRGERRPHRQPAAPGRHGRQGAARCWTSRPGPAARASSCRSRAPRSTSRTTPPTRAARSARRSRSTPRSRRPCDYQRTHPRHARRGHRRPRPHQPDRRGARPQGVTATLRTNDGARHDDQLRHGRRSPARSSTPAPRCGSPPAARRRPTCSA